MATDEQCSDCVAAVLAKLGLSDALGGPAPFWVRGYVEYLCYFRFSVDQIAVHVQGMLSWAEVFEEIKANYPEVKASDLVDIREQYTKHKIGKAKAVELAEELLRPKRKLEP